MPAVLLERLPLPSLRTYTAVSVALFSFAVYYAKEIVESGDFERSTQKNDSSLHDVQTDNLFPPFIMDSRFLASSNTNDGVLFNYLSVLLQEVWCIWTLINMALCCLILLGKLIQKLAFGELRVSEQQHIKDRFWNFLFYKFIFIFGVINVQNMDEVCAWSAWFAVLGFLHLLSQLCLDRFEYLSFSPTTPTWQHAKVLSLLVIIEVSVLALAILCILVGYHTGLNTATFIFAECSLLSFKCLYVILRYAIHLWDLHHEGIWENRAIYIYYSEFIFEMTSLSVDFMHHLHMLLWGNIFLSMASLVICMQLRYLFHELQRRLRRHRNYRRVVSSMQARFPMANAEEIEMNNDDCAICWDKMDSARKLPCGHLFHNSCLRSWLEQDTSCPTCRLTLSEPQTAQQAPPGGAASHGIDASPTRTNAQVSNHFFHFDGSRYVSWFPSFSVEVTHTNMLGSPQVQVNSVQAVSLMDNMARQVQAVFPSMPLSTISEDLAITRSVELTIENILEGRLQAPPTPFIQTMNSQESPEEPSEDAVEPHSSSEDSTPTSAPSPLTLEPPSIPSTSSTIPASITPKSEMLSPVNHQLEESIESSSRRVAQQPSGDSCLPSSSGSRFSKSSCERQSMLATRKETLLEVARRRYLAKRNSEAWTTVGKEESLNQQSNTTEHAQHHQSRHQLDYNDSSDELTPASHGASNNPTSYQLNSGSPESSGSSQLGGNENDEVSLKRELAFNAAQKRLNLC